MVVNLTKGQKVNLTKEAPHGLSKTLVGLGWDEVKPKLFSMFSGASREDADLDASVLMVSDSGIQETVYFSHKTSHDGSIRHSGDNLTGGGDGDDEQISIDFSKVSDSFNRLVVVVNIYNAHSRGQNFGQIENAYIHVDDQNGKELVRFDLTQLDKTATGVVVGEFTREGSDWNFTAVGKGVPVRGISEFEQYI